MLKGRIHSFESFGTVDGPGIRFIVFMQGCPLRCIYCHNRDTWDAKGGKEYTVDEVMDQINKYKTYMEFSGGGVTVTGGEPTLQANFVAALFKKCKEEGIHTALDTSGFVNLENIHRLIEYTDLVLLDIKQIDDEKHRTITGVGNEKIQAFAQYLAEHNIPVWIRYVLVPGFTDAKEDLQKTAEWLQRLKNIQRVDVLPYHSLGAYKWEKLGEYYTLSNVKEPSPEEVDEAKKILLG